MGPRKRSFFRSRALRCFTFLDGEVWCEIGYPRLVVEFFPGAAERKRCACFKEMDHSDQKQLYENCAPDANKCIIPPKAEETKKTDAKI